VRPVARAPWPALESGLLDSNFTRPLQSPSGSEGAISEPEQQRRGRGALASSTPTGRPFDNGEAVRSSLRRGAGR
jgi:hypothetical protein